MTTKQLAQTSDAMPATVGDPYTELMSAAIAQGEAGVAALERLVALQERRGAQEAERAYNAALARFQERCPPIPKLDRGQRGMYAKRNRIMAVIRPALAAEGLSVTFDSEDQGDTVTVLTHVRHSAGHRETSRIKVHKETEQDLRTKGGGMRMNRTQADGSALEYAQRYGLGQALGITTSDEDTDARDMHPPTDAVTEEQAADLRALCEEVGEDVGAFLARAGVDTFAGFPASFHARAVAYLERRRKERADWGTP